MKKKLKKVALSAGIAAVGALSLASCGESDAEKKAREAQEVQEQKKIEALRQDSIRQEQKKVQRADELYFNHVRDSVRQSKGYDPEAIRSVGNVLADLNKLKNYSYVDLYNHEISILWSELAAKASAEMEVVASEYGAILTPADGNPHNGLNWVYVFIDGAGNRYKELLAVLKKVDDKYTGIFEQKKNVLQKKYAAYYPILDLSKIPATYRKYFNGQDFDLVEGGRCDLRRLVVTRSVSVYDSKLDVNFFGEPGAKYELKSEGKGKWRVIRTNADGTVSKTPIFNHNVEYKTSGSTEPVVDKNGKVLPKPGNKFGFRPGGNKGVHVSFSEVVYVKDPEKIDDKVPDKDGKRAEEIKALEAVVAECEKHTAIREHADSVARAMLKERQAKR